jgi:lysophospholipase L1-like esterase
LVRALREAHPDTPIVIVENVPYQQGWFIQAQHDAYANKNAALKAAYDRLVEQGVKRLSYVPCDHLYGDDHEATVDGTHATDLGFLRLANAIEPALREALK